MNQTDLDELSFDYTGELNPEVAHYQSNLREKDIYHIQQEAVKYGFLKALTMVREHIETVNQFLPQGEGNSPIEVVELRDILQPFQDLLTNQESPNEEPDEDIEREQPYCTECGSDVLKYITTYANGDEYKCRNCKTEFVW